MKAVKINMSQKSSNTFLKALLAGTTINFLLIILLTIILSLLMVVSGSLFKEAASYLLLIPLAIGGYAGGYLSGRINKQSGMLIGAVSGFCVFLILLIISFCSGKDTISYMILLKAVALIISGIIGGIKGVNIKEKIKLT